MTTQYISVADYNYKTWEETFPDGNVKLGDFLPKYGKWREIFQEMYDGGLFEKIEERLTRDMKDGHQIFPYPDLVFYAFDETFFERIRVVILGQDPYYNAGTDKKKIIPQAMGLSFSIPIGVTIPSSLANVFKNLEKHDHLVRKQRHGNLQFWAEQGCLMLNTALTVVINQPNIHSDEWRAITNTIIRRISYEKEHIMFALWGAPAVEKMKLIDHDKHGTTVSSHPSGKSCATPLRTFGAFNDVDHFGNINKYLKTHYKTQPQIIWQLI